MLFDRPVYDRLVQESIDAQEYAKSISGVLPVAKSEAETELRLRSYPPRLTHDSGVHERVRRFVMRTPRTVTREVSTVHLYEDNIRRIVDDSTLDEQYQRKTVLYTHDNGPFAIRSVVSREDTLGAGFKITTPAFMVRKRDRIRIEYEGLYIDLTTTTVSGGGKGSSSFGGRGGRGGRGSTFGGRSTNCTTPSEPTVRYEVEIEIPDIAKFSHATLAKIVRTLFRVVRDTEVPYTVSMYAMMAEFHNTTLAQETSVGRALDVVDFDSRLQSRARPLKLKDLVYGGIVSPTVHYSVTPKADGVRTAFMIHNTGVWMYGGNGILNCLALSKIFDDLHGTILDMESIPMENRTAAAAKRFQYFLVAFDTLSVASNFSRGTTTIQSRDHPERMAFAEGLLAAVEERLSRSNPQLVMLRTKIFYYSLTVDQFFDSVASARHLLDSGVLPYKTDGLVFTPSNLKAIPYPDIHKVKDLKKRILTDYPDIVKFKIVTQLTIDFAVDVRGRQILSAGPGNSLVPFTTRGFNSVENVAWEDCEKQRIPRNAIVEFEWRDSQFHPVRMRSDREFPNRLDIARDNFEHIKEAISYDTIGGLTGVLMIRYHNRVKTLLYTSASMAKARLFPRASSGDYTLLDLGSGVGGDLHRWAKAGFTHVIAVEPSKSNAESLKRRLASIMSEGREAQTYPQVDVVQVGAEDTDSILTCSMKNLGERAKVDVISSMLSATFFWKDDTTFTGVVRTIKDHSKKGTLFLIFTINGQLIEELVSPSMREGVVVESPIVLGDFTLDLPLVEWAQIAGRQIGGLEGLLPHATGRSYHVTFKNTRTVHAMEGEVGTAQREYMVYIPQLTEALKPEFIMKSHEIANKEPLLLGPSRIASSLYSYAIYERIAE